MKFLLVLPLVFLLIVLGCASQLDTTFSAEIEECLDKSEEPYYIYKTGYAEYTEKELCLAKLIAENSAMTLDVCDHFDYVPFKQACNILASKQANDVSLCDHSLENHEITRTHSLIGSPLQYYDQLHKPLSDSSITRTSCAYELALHNGDSSLCEFIEKGYEQEACRFEIEEGGDLGGCAQAFETASWTSPSFFDTITCVEEFAQQQQEPRICLFASPRHQDCVLEFIRNTQDKKLCSFLIDENQEKCEQEFDKVVDLTSCEQRRTFFGETISCDHHVLKELPSIFNQ